MTISKNIILYSTADWNNPFWTNKQHTAIHLSQNGYRVLYIESLGLRKPTIKSQDIGRILRRIASFFKGSKKVQENIYVYSPLVIPLHRFKLIRLLNKYLLQFILKYLRIKYGMKKHIAWTYNPTIYELIASQNPEKIIYHNVDDLSAAPGMDSEMIKSTESTLLKNSNYVFCTSKKLYENSKSQAGERVHYFPNVVDFDHFYKSRSIQDVPNDLNINKPLIGFIGALSEYKFDFDLIKTTAENHPEWNFVLIGKIGEGQPDTDSTPIKLDNVTFLGAKPYAELPLYLANFDICMIPCPVNEYTQSMFPMKFFEYMAAGKPIIARNIKSLEDFTQSHYSYSTPKEFEDAITKVLETKKEKNPQLSLKLAKENTWENRLEKMIRIINSNSY